MMFTPSLTQTTLSLENSTLRSVHLGGTAARLEALLNNGVSQAPRTARVGHPHPLAGGTMPNKIQAMQNALSAWLKERVQ